MPEPFQVAQTHGFTLRLVKLAAGLRRTRVILGSGSSGKMCFYVTLKNGIREMEFMN